MTPTFLVRIVCADQDGLGVCVTKHASFAANGALAALEALQALPDDTALLSMLVQPQLVKATVTPIRVEQTDMPRWSKTR